MSTARKRRRLLRHDRYALKVGGNAPAELRTISVTDERRGHTCDRPKERARIRASDAVLAATRGGWPWRPRRTVREDFAPLPEQVEATPQRVGLLRRLVRLLRLWGVTG